MSLESRPAQTSAILDVHVHFLACVISPIVLQTFLLFCSAVLAPYILVLSKAQCYIAWNEEALVQTV